MVSGQKIKQLRLNNGWSQEQLSEISGLGIRTIQRIEKENKCSLESKMAIASAFAIAPNELNREASATAPLAPGLNRDGLIGLVLALVLVAIVANLAGDWLFYVDAWSILLITGLPLALSCISSGTATTLRLVTSLSWLVVLPKKRERLARMIPAMRRLIFYVYIAGMLGALMSCIAILSNIPPNHPDFWPAMAIALLNLFYALLLAELLLRPLKHKYEQMIAG